MALKTEDIVDGTFILSTYNKLEKKSIGVIQNVTDAVKSGARSGETDDRPELTYDIYFPEFDETIRCLRGLHPKPNALPLHYEEEVVLSWLHFHYTPENHGNHERHAASVAAYRGLKNRPPAETMVPLTYHLCATAFKSGGTQINLRPQEQ